MIGFKCQYFDNDWTLKNRTLGFKEFEEAHTGINIKAALEDFIKYIGIRPEQVNNIHEMHSRMLQPPSLNSNR